MYTYNLPASTRHTDLHKHDKRFLPIGHSADMYAERVTSQPVDVIASTNDTYNTS